MELSKEKKALKKAKKSKNKKVDLHALKKSIEEKENAKTVEK